MKKLIILSVLTTCLSCTNTQKLDNLITARINNDKSFILNFDKTTNYKIKKIDELFLDVLKTDKQLIPKYCNYLVITGVKNAEFDLAKNDIRLSILANSTVNPNFYIYIDNKQEAFDKITNLLKNEKNVITYSNESELIQNIYEKKNNNDKLNYRRILLLTSSTNMRIYYSKLINVLEDNKQDMIIDNFAYLYNTTREEYEHPSKEEIKNSYSQIKNN
ncbi:hypothetical protein [Oceanivirga miroungae]|uniref:Uncharacterized protein n=1 Tax=Oceanivirga miroungae TaxID=1130046 RepID=A0A6I8M4F0_9FUSO|nr:hypothetical protein [Oceanivirga miroungae]VWL84774.1 hypothetical protein OMES3154_00022 [Oceanivirga miroungae]